MIHTASVGLGLKALIIHSFIYGHSITCSTYGLSFQNVWFSLFSDLVISSLVGVQVFFCFIPDTHSKSTQKAKMASLYFFFFLSKV